MRIIEVKDFQYAKLQVVFGERPIGLVTAMNKHIPLEVFKMIFHEAGAMVRALKITTLIFDKRALTVFHQPSMEWYFSEWKEDMYHFGLCKHIKILPINPAFRKSVSVGRTKINRAYPNGQFHQMEILYAESLMEAVNM